MSSKQASFRLVAEAGAQNQVILARARALHDKLLGSDRLHGAMPMQGKGPVREVSVRGWLER